MYRVDASREKDPKDIRFFPLMPRIVVEVLLPKGHISFMRYPDKDTYIGRTRTFLMQYSYTYMIINRLLRGKHVERAKHVTEVEVRARSFRSRDFGSRDRTFWNHHCFADLTTNDHKPTNIGIYLQFNSVQFSSRTSQMCKETMTATPPDAKIVDLLKKREEGSKPFVSIEFFPPRSDQGVKNLYARMERMKDAISPLFTDMTWGAGGSTAELTMQLATHAHEHGHVSNMHLTCTNMEKDGDPKKAVHEALTTAKANGIRNIVALRGDPPAGEEEWKAVEGGFTCALDLVEYIRENFGQDFGISVAGYPEGHPNAISEIEDPSTMTESEKGRSSTFDGKVYTCKDEDYKKEMDYLKKKIDAGADFIITQMFFDTKVFATFVEDCKKWGINCPVVPGLMCINAYAGFCKMTKFCKTRVTPELQAKMDSMKDDPDAVKAFGVEFGIQMCKDLTPLVDVLHFYTLNLEKVTFGILEGLGYEVKSAADEADAESMVAKGSAWARVGDTVKTSKGNGVVQEIGKDGSAIVAIEGGETLTFKKEEYSKVF